MNIVEAVNNFVAGLKATQVPRIEDLPYWTSPPIQFVYESTATLNLGQYVWDDTPSSLAPNRPILENAVYYFRHITLAADISEQDFQRGIIVSPKFYSFLRSHSEAPLFREPISMNKYYDQFSYRLTFASQQTNDQLLCAFRGQLLQHSGLVGTSTVTLKAIISAQEIVDEHFVDSFKENYPAVNKIKGDE